MEQLELLELLNEMTIDEKIGQLVQLTPDFFSEGGEITGPMQKWNLESEKLYQIGSILGTHTSEQVYSIQQDYLKKSRLSIPLIFMADVIHGYETIFPIPLALAATFDEAIVEKMAELSAKEATEAGIHVTFSPMADYVKDARWGRVLESNGEDVTLSNALTKAYVKGYQGEDLSKDKNRLASCVKHFIGYGAAEGGRDYNTVDLSDIEIAQNYLPPFEAAIDAGAELVMTSFNTVHGIPSTANTSLIQKILRKQLNFKGVVISDWAAVVELIAHRVAEDKKEAALLAFSAGIDMDMMSDSYLSNLKEIINNKNKEKLDEAVLRILNLKNKLGLFEDPYRGLTKKEFDKNKNLRISACEIAEKCSVLLKNENILPLIKNQKVALIGPKAKSRDILGAWSWIGDKEEAVSLSDGLQKKDIELSVLGFQDGRELSDKNIKKAVRLAEGQDIVILAVGETSQETGEAASLTNINLTRNQEKLIMEVSKVNKNIVLVLFNGRPVELSSIECFVKGILVAWFPGTEGGHALANLLMGEANPQGKLPMSFPRAVGQLPYTYAHLSTGRPQNEENKNQKYISRYMDEETTPLYPFGFGLSYSDFELQDIKFSKKKFKGNESISIDVTVKNKNMNSGSTVIQLYSQDIVTTVARPVRELKKWIKIDLLGHDEKRISFSLTERDLRYVHPNLKSKVDSGKFNLYLGFDSLDAKIIGTVEYHESN
ncbi:beta-glucosidase [Marinilactibacillus piezotolerans]|uniref:beta-glucosidase n=1 Tax=Marinilactibacillus piezotolerans TaxID=258723 RepID=A0A1I3ZP91_9LACT|nr:glycoside hydrolase family 3 N-terminal domain-containing protein [Marinilactibacillus piezotolerans]SFK45730.1 beta-glucosidase [Marinilactibacillus piezotolerans]